MSRSPRLKRTRRMRTAIFIAGDVVIWAAAMVLAFLIRFDGAIPARDLARIPVLLAIFITVKTASHLAFRVYRMTWRLVGLTDIVTIWKANSIGSLLGIVILLFLKHKPIFGFTPRSVLVMDYVLSLGGIAAFRTGRRLFELQRGRLGRRRPKGRKRLLLVGAGAAGDRLVRAMQEDATGLYEPIGFIDDDVTKHGSILRGLPVFGDRREIGAVVRRHAVAEVVIAIPSATSAQLRGLLDAVREAGVRQVRMLPGVHELLSARVRLQDIREVNIDDLLGRPPVHIQMDAIGASVAGVRVLVTGAAGSIGSQIVRQLTRFSCGEIIAVDNNETGLFELEEAVRALESSVPVRTVVADIRDKDKVQWLFRTHPPAVLFHAAAYKHVPLMERHVDEAVKTNVRGTYVLAEAAMRSGVGLFVLISTDKAVNPINILGLTKRVAEQIVQVFSQRGRTRYVAVRFGNVLGSRGSLVPVLQEQIRKGGPVTLTHPEMRRYFMSIAEAVLLVLQCTLIERQAGVFVLDMGEPVRILDLATELIRLSGLEPDKDIPIVFTGVRPGEKLEEELAESDETMLPTQFEKIHEIRPNGLPSEMSLRLTLQELDRLAQDMDADGMRALLQHLVRGEGHAAFADVAGVPAPAS